MPDANEPDTLADKIEKAASVLATKDPPDFTSFPRRTDTSKMTPAEYAAFTGAMSHPVGQVRSATEAVERQACQAADADYVNAFMRALEDPDMRLVTEKPGNWKNWSDKRKAAILAALREGHASMRARAKLAVPPQMLDREQLHYLETNSYKPVNEEDNPMKRTVAESIAHFEAISAPLSHEAAQAFERIVPAMIKVSEGQVGVEGDASEGGIMSEQFEPGQTVWSKDNVKVERLVVAVRGKYLWLDACDGRAPTTSDVDLVTAIKPRGVSNYQSLNNRGDVAEERKAIADLVVKHCKDNGEMTSLLLAIQARFDAESCGQQ